VWDVCERFARFGVPLHFTETTIISGRRGWELTRKIKEWPSTEEGEAFQAREVERFYTMLFSHPAVEAITWWDFSDRGAWQRAPAGFLRRDLTPKPAYETLKELIKKKWWTTATVVADSDGVARYRGILGQYSITVKAVGREPVVRNVELKKGEPNEFVVTIP
jgi:hypothetical protein